MTLPHLSSSVLTLIIGGAMALLGYPLYRISLKVAGAILGFYLGHVLGGFLGQLLGAGQNTVWLSIGAAILLALLGGSFLRRWTKAMLFAGGFILGLMIAGIPISIGSGVSILNIVEQVLQLVLQLNIPALLAGLIGGILGVFLEWPIVVLLTAFWGAILVSSVIQAQWIMGATLIVGILCQTLVFRRRRRKA